MLTFSFYISTFSGDKDPSKAPIAETSKLIGNSVYGHSVMRKDRHTTVRITGLVKASKLLNDPLMSGFEELDDETFEVYTTWSLFSILAYH